MSAIELRIKNQLKMKKLTEYIQNLRFAYAISYSGLRGEKFEGLVNKNKAKIQQIEKQIESARFMQIPKLKKEIKILNDEINIHNSRVIKKNGEFHNSAQQIHRFEKGSQELRTIFEILNSKNEAQVAVTCTPVFRDSIVFYSKEDTIIGILQICFSCARITNENEEALNVNYKIFEILKKQLILIGHPIK